MKNIYFISIAIVLFSFSSLSAQTLLAEYPLLSDGVDISGNNAEMTILEAPFQNGGIYSNGIYTGTTPWARTFKVLKLLILILTT